MSLGLEGDFVSDDQALPFGVEVAVTPHLGADENGVDPQGHHRQHHIHRGAEVRLRGAAAEVGNHQGQHAHGADQIEVSQGTQQVGAHHLAGVHLAVIAEGPAAHGGQQIAETGHPSQGDHHHREHGIPSQGRVALAGQHRAGDERQFDCHHRRRQHQGPVGLPDQLGHPVCLIGHAAGEQQHHAAQQNQAAEHERGGLHQQPTHHAAEFD